MRRATAENIQEYVLVVLVVALIAYCIAGCGPLRRVDVAPFVVNREFPTRDEPDGDNRLAYGVRVNFGFDIEEDETAAQLRMLRADWLKRANAERLLREQEARELAHHSAPAGGDGDGSPLTLLDKTLAVTTKYGVDATLVLLLFSAGLYLWFVRGKRKKQAQSHDGPEE